MMRSKNPFKNSSNDKSLIIVKDYNERPFSWRESDLTLDRHGKTRRIKGQKKTIEI